MKIEQYNSIEKIDPRQWHELLVISKTLNPFLSYEWLQIWCKNFITNHDGCQFYTFFKPENSLIAVIPLHLQTEKLTILDFKVLSFTANSHSYRTQFIAHPQYKEQVVENWLSVLFKDKKFDYVKFKEFLYDQEIINFLVAKKTKFSLEEEKHPPYIEIHTDWQSYFNGLRGHFRRNLRRRLRNAGKEFGKVEYRIFSGNDKELEKVVFDGFKLEASGWKGKKGSAILKNEQVKQFYFDIAHTFYQKQQLHLGSLYFDDRLVAFNFSLVYENIFYLLKVAYDERVAKFSPGQIMIYFLLQHLFEKKIKRFDFLGPAMPWKLEWTQTVNKHYTLYIYGKTKKGQLLFLLNRKILPYLRQIKLLRKIKHLVTKSR